MGALMRALVIEDDTLIAMVIEDQLTKLGYRAIDLAHSQQEAISLAERQCPDLITVDEKLDSGSGVAAIRHICRDQAIPVVFITVDAETVLKLVPDAVIIEKPISLHSLAPAIKSATEKARVY
jgi:DNA-binding response OmpR family regulator